MTFKENLRLEQIYFLKLKDIVSDLTAWKVPESDKKTFDILNSCIAADEAILLLYKNIGEAYNDLASQIVSEKAALEALKAELESTKDELNAKIDDVNNFLNAIVTGIEARVAGLEGRMTAVENDLDSLDRIKLYTMKFESNVRTIYDGTEPATTEGMLQKIADGYTLVLRYDLQAQPQFFIVQSYSASNVVFYGYSMNWATYALTVVRVLYSNDTVSYSTKALEIGTIDNRLTSVEAGIKKTTETYSTSSSMNWETLSGITGYCLSIGAASPGTHIFSSTDYTDIATLNTNNAKFVVVNNIIYFVVDDNNYTFNFTYTKEGYYPDDDPDAVCVIVKGW